MESAESIVAELKNIGETDVLLWDCSDVAFPIRKNPAILKVANQEVRNLLLSARKREKPSNLGASLDRGLKEFFGSPLWSESLQSGYKSLFRTDRVGAASWNLYRRTVEKRVRRLWMALSVVSSQNVKKVVIPNGRLPHEVALEAYFGRFDVEVSYFEIGIASGTFFWHSFKPHDLDETEAYLNSSPQPLSLEHASKWLSSRRQPNGLENEFAKWNSRVLKSNESYEAIVFTSSNDEFAFFRGSSTEDGLQPSQHEVLTDLVSRCIKMGLEVAIRCHPNIGNKSMTYYLGEVIWLAKMKKKFGVKIIGPFDKSDSYVLGMRAKFVFTWWSSIGFELSAGGKCVFQAQDSIFMRLGAVHPLLLEGYNRDFAELCLDHSPDAALNAISRRLSLDRERAVSIPVRRCFSVSAVAKDIFYWGWEMTQRFLLPIRIVVSSIFLRSR